MKSYWKLKDPSFERKTRPWATVEQSNIINYIINFVSILLDFCSVPNNV